ncbi:MAG: HEAT repeat domain-containing protein [Phycisphaerae bacterium]|nr:HEAT repeat domain-containing protein [Phycisphaerae bacterium]
MMKLNVTLRTLVSLMMIAALPLATWAADDAAARKEKEQSLIKIIESNAPPQDKAIPCKQLAIYGSKDAVPALAALLPDANLSSWARIALEAIPDPAADAALRDAMGKVKGRLLVGVINSIGVRKDAGSVEILISRLSDTDADVASAAAVALGHIGGDAAAKALQQSLNNAPDHVRNFTAEGCILAAEQYLAVGKAFDAIRLYDAVRKANVPKQKMLEGTRGAILARGAEGFDLLAEQLKSDDQARVGIGLRTARELSGKQVTESLASLLAGLPAERQPMLLLAIADRSDPAVQPAIVNAANNGSKEVRMAAVRALDRFGGVSSVPVLLEAAGSDDAGLAEAAKTTLSRLSGSEIDSDLLERIPQATGKTRKTLFELAAMRRIETATTAVATGLEDTDAGIRGAAVQALGVIGTDQQLAGLVSVLGKTQNAAERGNIERSLVAISKRSGEKSIAALNPLMQSGTAEVRVVGLHAMAAAGGPQALAAVQSGINDKEEMVQDEAVRTLSTWPNNWPEDAAAGEALATLAKSGKKMNHQVLGLRGYLQYLQGNTKLGGDGKSTRVGELMPLLNRPEEKRLAIAALGGAPTARSLELLTALAADTAVSEDAYSSLVALADKEIKGASKEQVRSALLMVKDKTKNDRTRNRANEALKKF